MRLLTLAVAFALLASTAVAEADGSLHAGRTAPSSADLAAAEALFDEGRKLLTSGQIKLACPKFAESYRLDPALGSLLNLAACHQLEGKTASAWAEFREAEQQARRAGDVKRQAFAAERAADLEERVPKLTVVLSGAPKGLVVRRDDVVVGDASFNVPIPLNPGEHLLRAEAPGKRSWELRVEAVSGKSETVVIPPLETAAPSATSPSGISRPLGYGIGGVGLVGVAIGVVFGALFFDEKSYAEACEPPRCARATYEDAKSAAEGYGTVSGIAFGVGAASLIGGALLVLSTPSAPKPGTATGPLTPWIGVSASGATAGAVGRF